MARIHYDDDADLNVLAGRRVAVLGYGSQGHAHALNLRDNGVDVRVGLPAGSRSRPRAAAEGLRVLEPDAACAEADLVMLLAPDLAQPPLYEQHVRAHLRPGQALFFAHGFNVRYGTITPPPGIDVALVAPKAPGHRVREVFREGQGTPALVAVHQDASGRAWPLALAYAKGIGCTRAGVLETTFAEETETDLFGEQAVLCGGVSALVKAGFETLVEAGYQPEIAYFECLHELKLIVDLMYRGGLGYMRHSVSDTAEHGDYSAGARVVTAQTRQELRALLADIRSGAYARAWIDEHAAGRPWFEARRAEERAHPIEAVGARLRALMPFLDALAVTAEGDVVPAASQARAPEPVGIGVTR